MYLTKEATYEEISEHFQKWMGVFTTPIDKENAKTVISDLYLKAGYLTPKVIFLDSPFAVMLSAGVLIRSTNYRTQSISRQLLSVKKELIRYLLDQLLSKYSELVDSPLLNYLYLSRKETKINSSRYYQIESKHKFNLCRLHQLAQPFSQKFANEIFWCEWKLNGDSWELEDPHPENPYTRPGYISHSDLLNHTRIDLLIGLLCNRNPYKDLSQLTWFGCIAEAATFEYAASLGYILDSQSVQLLLNCATNLGFILPFEDICFVSDRPQLKYDGTRLHAEGEPAILYADGLGEYYYHGLELPPYAGITHPSRWKSEWVLLEKNAEVRRVLIQEIGYAKISQELQLEELDSWREYTLLKLPIYDDYSNVPSWKRDRDLIVEEDIKSTYLLKMICPSTGFIYVLRVPPDMKSAREAAAWINWEVDPATFTAET